MSTPRRPSHVETHRCNAAVQRDQMGKEFTQKESRILLQTDLNFLCLRDCIS